MTKFNVTEMFHSIAGEAPRIGNNIVFLRLAKCNLKCSWCDSKYSWKEGRDISIKEVIDYIKATNANGLSITGGEPLLQRETIIQLVNVISERTDFPPSFYIEIETNGTINPGAILLYSSMVRFNVSPKLENSGNSFYDRYRIEPLTLFSKDEFRYKVILKFVYTDNSGLEEIKQIIKNFGFQKFQVYLMPEGITRSKQLASQQRVVDVALENGWNFSPRLHVLIWNTKKGV